MDIPIKLAYTLSLLLKREKTRERIRTEAFVIEKSIEKYGFLPCVVRTLNLATSISKTYEGFYNELLYGVGSSSRKTPARGVGCFAKIGDKRLNQRHEDFQSHREILSL
jgi:hypothetical protein